jgi:hypothetical protein
VINGLGLFAALGSPDAAQPQTAPAEDPAVFAAALVAALGLQQPVQVTIAPPQPAVEGETTTEEGEEAPSEGDTPAMTDTTEEAPEQAAPVVARVTPDPEAVEELKTFDRIPVAQERVSPRQAIDVVSDEPATPAKAGTQKLVPLGAKAAEPDTPSESGAATLKHTDTGTAPTTTATPAPSAAPMTNAAGSVPAAPVVDDRSMTGDSREAASSKEKAEAQSVAPRSTRKVKEHAVEADPTASAPIQPDLPPVVPGIVPPVELTRDVAQAEARTSEANAREPVAPVDIPSPEGRVPPQSMQERTARAMAENVRVGRQLAEILGEEHITEFKVELGKRPNGDIRTVTQQQQMLEEQDAPVTWQRVSLPLGGETISGQMLPRDGATSRVPRKAVQGTFAQEAIEPVIARPFSREPVTITTVTSRPEIVRMVANASLAISPNLAQTEGNPAVAKAPAPSVTPSLPDVRQEIPAAAAGADGAASEDGERREARESHSSADASASSIASANNTPANKSAPAPENGRESREARNLPSHESTDQKAAGSADRVTLQVADDEGRQTRIRVSVTGSQIRAVITPPDTMSARQLEQRMDQLHETLVRQGFTDPKVVVRAAPEMGSDAAAVAAGNQDARSAVPAGKDQPAGEQRQGRGQREQDRGDGHRHPQGHSRGRDPRDRRR